MKTTRLALILVLGLLAAGILSAQTATAPASGDGSSGNPFRIASLENLYWISQNSAEWDKHYLQTANIDASETSTWDDGAGWTPIGDATTRFTGSYNGQGHTISNLYIDRSGRDNVGLFGHIGESGDGDGVVIQNLGLINAGVTGARGTGSLVGRVTGDEKTVIQKCYASGGGVLGDGATGGLVGSNNSHITNPGNRDHHPTISRCYAVVNVSWSGNGAGDKIGGLTGCNEKGRILNSYARGNVLTSGGTIRVGGLAGCILIRGYIENSYSTGQVTGGTNVGGFVGSGGTGDANGETVGCIWDVETSGQSSSSPTSGCTGKTTAWMKNHNNFIGEGWDFELETVNGTQDIWDMDYSGTINDGYPFLSWENGDDISLPVSLVYFSARVEGRSVILEWVTESEVDNLGFLLERSENGGDWIMIASYRTHDVLKGQGNTSARTEYRFADNAVEPGTSYAYRLSDVSTRGEITRHAPLSITVAAPPDATVMENAYPNPFNPRTYIAYRLAEDSEVHLSVFDMQGRQVKSLYNGQQIAGSYHVYWNATNEAGNKAPSGGYIIQMKTANTRQTQKVILIK